MFEWLEQELCSIKTPRFHVTDGPAGTKLQKAISRSVLPLPLDYKEFVLKFGNAKLYRNASNSSYQIGVFAAPREALVHNTRIYHIGFHDGASVYMKHLSNTTALPIFEFESGSEEEVASGFQEWLSASCDAARNRYSKAQWAQILRGPKPFTKEEMEIVEARRAMRWRVLGIDDDGNHTFEVTNTGRRALAALTVGARSKDGRLNGGIRLDVRNVGPGKSALVHASCYKNLVPPEQLEMFALPDPLPEDREYYWEFKAPM